MAADAGVEDSEMTEEALQKADQAGNKAEPARETKGGSSEGNKADLRRGRRIKKRSDGSAGGSEASGRGKRARKQQRARREAEAAKRQAGEARRQADEANQEIEKTRLQAEESR